MYTSLELDSNSQIIVWYMYHNDFHENYKLPCIWSMYDICITSGVSTMKLLKLKLHDLLFRRRHKTTFLMSEIFNKIYLVFFKCLLLKKAILVIESYANGLTYLILTSNTHFIWPQNVPAIGQISNLLENLQRLNT